LPPDSGTGKMSRLFAEVRWFLLLAICLGLFAVLVTYTKSDPAWSHASFETPKNIGGRMGAWTADLMFYVLGPRLFGGSFCLHDASLANGASCGAFPFLLIPMSNQSRC
jgi:hypothetical protein